MNRFPTVGLVAWCAGLMLPLGVMAWLPPSGMQAVYLLTVLAVFYGGGGLVGLASSHWAQERWGKSHELD